MVNKKDDWTFEVLIVPTTELAPDPVLEEVREHLDQFSPLHIRFHVKIARW